MVSIALLLQPDCASVAVTVNVVVVKMELATGVADVGSSRLAAGVQA
jgi:hypothetical protein